MILQGPLSPESAALKKKKDIYLFTRDTLGFVGKRENGVNCLPELSVSSPGQRSKPNSLANWPGSSYAVLLGSFPNPWPTD